MSGPFIPKTKPWALPSVHSGHRGKPHRQAAPVAGSGEAVRPHAEDHRLNASMARWKENVGWEQKGKNLISWWEGEDRNCTRLRGEKTGLWGR